MSSWDGNTLAYLQHHEDKGQSLAINNLAGEFLSDPLHQDKYTIAS